MNALLIAAIMCALGTVVYVAAADKFAEVGRAALWAGMFAVAALLCGLL
jgi:hypothetical protein